MDSDVNDEIMKESQPKSMRLQNLANILTVLVAVVAIGLSVWEGRENRLHNRLSVLPHLKSVQSISRDGIEDNSYTMTYAIDNSGLGPAVLQSILIYHDGASVYDSDKQENAYDFSSFLQELNDLPFPVSSFTNGHRTGEMLRPGMEHLLFRLEVPVIDTLSQWSAGIVKDSVVNRYSFVICYCSVYGENCGETILGGKPPINNSCRF